MRDRDGRFKHWFIPYAGNEGQPHFLRASAMVAVIAVALLLEGSLLLQSSAVLPPSRLLSYILNSVLIDETNQNRAAADLNTLKENPVLDAAAAAKANDMATKGYFAHTSPAGITPWHWFEEFGYNYEYAGENLAVNFTDSEDVTTAWMNSPLHRANILNQHFTEIGIASARGVYQGHEAVFVVQFFGTPAGNAASGPLAAAGPPAAHAAPAPAPTEVLGASANAPQTGETFVATSAPTAAPLPAASQGPVTSMPGGLGFLTNPRHVVDAIAVLLALLVLGALGLKIYHVGFAYPHLIRNGLTALLVLLAIVAFNHYSLFAQIRVF